MRLVMFGLAFLLGTMVPTGSKLISFLGLKSFVHGEGAGAALLQLTVYVVTYGLALLLVVPLTNLCQLRARLPDRVPGRYLICTGLTIAGVYMGLRVLSATIQGGGFSFGLAMMSSLFILPSLVLVALGVIRALFAAYRNPKCHKDLALQALPNKAE